MKTLLQLCDLTIIKNYNYKKLKRNRVLWNPSSVQSAIITPYLSIPIPFSYKVLKTLLTSVILLFTLNSSLAQVNERERANFWHFGNTAGLDFTTCSPVSFSGSQLNSFEGSASISDINGNLLFYTDGETVWDRNNNIMPNGTGLLGDRSTVQSAVIVPRHGNPNWYYIFTAGTSLEDNGTVGVRFSEVDMTLNGGLGDVIPGTKNTLLFIPNEEKLTAVRNATSTGYWVAAQEKSSNRWYTYEVTAAGVNMTPVISITGPGARPNNSLGAKFSPDGKMLVTQNGCAGGSPPQPNWNASLCLYSFDNSTGQLTYLWDDCGTAGFNLAFSQDCSKLYAAGFQMYQYDLSAGTGISDSTAIIATRTQITTSSWAVDALQLAPDCKIYIAEGGTSIGVIQNPSLAGTACGYTTGSFNLSSGSTGQRFTNFVQSFFEYPCTAFFTFQDTCLNDSTLFNVEVCNPVDSVRWDFNDPLGSPSNTSTSLTPYHIFSGIGSYNVQLISYINGVPDTVISTVTIGNCSTPSPLLASFNPSSLTVCEGDSITFTDNSTGSITGWTWTFNGGSPASANTQGPHTVGFNTAGNYNIILQVTDGTNTDDTTIAITVNPADTAAFTYPSGSYCLTDPNPSPANTGTSGGTYSIDNSGVINSSTGEINITSSGIGSYTVTYITSGSCPDTATFNINIVTSTDATITQAGPFCENDSAVNLTAVDPGGNWTGNGITNATNGTFDPATAGAGTHQIIYTITGSCGDADTISIIVNPADTAAFTYPSGSYCLTDPNPSPANTGTSGGTYSIDNSGVINSSTGEINITSSGIGSYTVTYITSGSCPDTATFNINIVTSTDATITQAGPFCENDSAVNLTAVDPGGNWTGNGITNATNGTFDPATAGAGTHQIIYTITGSCGDADTISIIVNPADTAAFTYPSGSYCLTDPNPLPNITGTTGGTFSIDNSGVINSSTGEVNITGSGVGSYTVTYITSGSCPDTATFNINIVTSTDATITQAGPFCENDPAVNLSAVSTGGTWTGNGITNATNGTFDPSTAGAGNHVITYTISGSCGDVDTMTITVNPADDATFNFSNSSFCISDSNPLPSGIVTTGGTFSIDNGGTINGATGEINLSASGTGNFVITYITNGSCPDTNTFSITINAISDATITPSGPFCSADPAINLAAFDNGGTWSGNGITNATNGTFDPSTAGAGNHQIIYSIPGNCGDADTINITVSSSPSLTLTSSDDNCFSEEGSVISLVSGGITPYSYSWNNGANTPSIDDLPAGTYSLTVTDSAGCSNSAIAVVNDQNVDCDYHIFLPNIFSPNGDGHNDVFRVRGEGIKTVSLVVYSRWGEKVFETTDPDIGWNGNFKGQEMNAAVFVYYLKATMINNELIEKQGNVTLVR